MELDLDLDLQEPSMLTWARAQGICVNYKTELLHAGKLHAPPSDDYDQHLQDPSDTTIANAVSALIKERLTVNTDAALLLKATHSLQEATVTDAPTIDSWKRIRDLKHELPVLRSDHDLDLLNFGNIAVPDFRDLQIPSDTVVQDNDEGFEWPTKYSIFPAQCDAQVKAEKLAISREVLVYLQDTIRDAYVPEDGIGVEAESSIRRQKSIFRLVTPPLLPLSPPLAPYIPSSPANRLPLASESSDSITIEAQALQDHIMAADALIRKGSDSSDSMLLDITHPPQFSPLFDGSTLPILKRRAEDLKVESPLIPPMFSTSPMKKLKSVSFADTLHEYIPHEPWGQGGVTGEGNKSEIDSDQFFRDIEPLAEQVRMKVDNERLSGADTIARVHIPDVDFTLPMAPWNEYSQRKSGKHRPGDTELEEQMKFLLRIKRVGLKSAMSWRGLSIPERKLKWGFLDTKVSTLSLEEKLHGEPEVTKAIFEVTVGNIATSSSQVWKREGLRILDDEEEEEDLDPAEDEERRDMDTLIRKRKLEMEEEVSYKNRKRTSLKPTTRSQIQFSDVMQKNQHFDEHKRPQDLTSMAQSDTMDKTSQKNQSLKCASGDMMFAGFSASTALHKFMETRGKPAKVVESSASKVSDLKNKAQARIHTLPVRSRGSSSDQIADQSQHVRTANRPLPMLPAVPSNLVPCSFMISSTFLQRRGMLKLIELIYPNAEMVYRDYALPHSAAKEADIILSPSTGLIFTTVQQIKQIALPGQPDRSPVKERMLALQVRYERLVVLVSEGLSREMEELGSSRPDDMRDKEALKACEIFANQLEGEVLVRHVRGGEQALARSTVVEMANYGLPYGSADIGDIKPVAPETSWEVFLRRVGFNPFAAQVIAAWLQKSLNVPIAPSSASHFQSHNAKTVSAFGLARFLLMSEEERLRSFQALMGGSRVLTSASKLMDRAWISAAHGFRM